MDACISNKSFYDFEFIMHIFWKSIDFGKFVQDCNKLLNNRYRNVCGIVIESQRFSCALPSVGGIDVSCWWGVSPLSVYFFLFGGGDVWVLRIHPWRCGIQAPVLLEMVRSV
jgi:hypothetical protein